MNSKCSACSAQYQNISLYIKGQRTLIRNNWLDVIYLFIILVFIKYFAGFLQE